MNNINIGPITLETPIIAAASSATARLEDLRILNRTSIGAIITKSGTVLAREGNPELNYFSEDHLTINALGLPGPDLDGTMQMLESFNVERKKPLILSLAGMKPEEYLYMIRQIRRQIAVLFDAVELNLSCPNVAGKPIISCDPETTSAITEEILTDLPRLVTGIKIAPFFSEAEQGETAKKIQEHLDEFLPGHQVKLENSQTFGEEALLRAIDHYKKLQSRGLVFISATNTFPNCKILRPDGSTLLNSKANGGKGGLSSHFLRPIALRNVATLRREMGLDINIIGTGGIYNGLTAEQFLDAGANAVAIGTALIDRGPKVVDKILLELV